ncbi:MAG: sigma-54 factor interaction domain-containing protein, partial [Bacillota bacterium]
MKTELLTRFPKFIRLDSQYRVELTKDLDQGLQKIIQNSLRDHKLTLEKSLTIEQGILKAYQVSGSSKYLVTLNEEFGQLFPIEKLTDYPLAPQAVIDLIVDWIKQSIQFERLDLVRINHPLRRFHFEYSMGMDIEGVIRSAYKDVEGSALSWLLSNLKPYLVESLTPEKYRFNEDPFLDQTGFRSILRVPIISNRDLTGAILLGSMTKDAYQLEDAILLQNLAQSVSQGFLLAGIQQQQEYNTLATSTLLQTSAALYQPDQYREFLEAYCSTLCQLAKVNRVIFLFINEQDATFKFVAEAGKKLTVLNKWYPIGDLPIMEMLKTKCILAFNLADPSYRPLVRLLGQGLTAVLYAPITDEHGNIIACLGTASSDERAMSKEVAGIFKEAAEQLGFILTRGFNSGAGLKTVGYEGSRQTAKVKKPVEFGEIIGSSTAILEAIEKTAAAAPYEFPILLRGETGTGKELFAKAVHRSSLAADGPFIVVNSAAIPGNLLESELFGYKEGAFTGGLRGGKRGKILLANGGTLFLDEIGELSMDLQAKLLRVIQEQEVEPLGAEEPVPVKVRIISATHRDLEEMVANQQFREDLYYRLNSIQIHIPPLKD